MDDEADRHQPLAEMIEERAAAGLVVERPAHGVLDEAGPVLLGRHLPQLLQADAEFLRARLGVQPELPDQHLGQRAAGAFGEECVFPRKRDARRVVVLMAAVAGDTHVAGDHALDLAARAEDHIGDGEAWVDLDP